MADSRQFDRETTLTTPDGVRISVRHRSLGRPDAVLVAPGFFQSKDTPTFRAVIRELLTRVDVAALDFRGHGRSSGRYAFSAREAADLTCAARMAGEHHERVWALGFSYGGSIALLAQERSPLFAGIICVGSPMRHDRIELEWWRRSSLRSGRRSMEPGIGCRIGSIWAAKRPALDAVAALTSTPLLFIHGTEDRIVYPRHSVRLFDAARAPKQVRFVPGGGHAEDLFRTHSETVWPIVWNWLLASGARLHRVPEAAEIS